METRNEIANLTQKDIDNALHILYLLECISYEKMDDVRGQRYRDRLDIVYSDVSHIKDLI